MMLPDRAERAFLYVEVLAAMSILAFVLLATAPMFILAARENAAASDLTFASTLAYDMAENLKDRPWDALVPGSDVAQLHDQTFDRNWTIAEDTPHAGLRTVTVTVTPARIDGMGGQRVATVNFYRTR